MRRHVALHAGPHLRCGHCWLRAAYERVVSERSEATDGVPRPTPADSTPPPPDDLGQASALRGTAGDESNPERPTSGGLA